MSGTAHTTSPSASLDERASIGPVSGQPVSPLRRGIARGTLLLWAVLVVLCVAATFWIQLRLSALSGELAQRLQAGDLVAQEAKLFAKNAQDVTQDLQARITALDSQLQDSRSKQLALEQVYQDLSRNRDDWMLAELEQVLAMASQQLQLTGNVRTALTVLQDVEARLGRADKPQFMPVRRALLKDIEQLKALPIADLNGATIKLDEALKQIDRLPLLSDVEHPSPAPSASVASAPSVRGLPALGELASRVWASICDEAERLLRVRRVQNPAALLAAPEQTWFLRENLKLRLLNARMALLSRNYAVVRSDLTVADELLVTYFDPEARATQLTQTLIRQARSSAVDVELPTLAESLAAVHGFRNK